MPLHPDAPAARLLPDTATVSGGVIAIAGRPVPQLAELYGTPLYVFDRATILHACAAYREAFAHHYHASAVHIRYAAKAYLSPMLARIIAAEGMGLDAVSAGELLVAQVADFPMERVTFHGNNKSEEELRLALRLGVGRVALDNWSELARLTRIAQETGERPRVLLRVAPAVAAATHRYLQTGHAAAKFGFALGNGEARAALERILREGRLHLLGLHAHIGTMLRETRPYEETLERLLALAHDVYTEMGWWPEEISPGGGWAIDTPDESALPIEELARACQRSMERTLVALGQQRRAPALTIEPGRSIIARAGVAVYRIGARKATPGSITYLFVDGGMGDNIRPALYGAHYTALPVERAAEHDEERVCIAGRYCESGDVLIESIDLPVMHEEELLLLPGAGAYCLPMASNYNLIPRPAVILVDERRIEVMECRETCDDLLARYR